MPLKFGNTTAKKIVYNNVDLTDLIFNGTKVFTKRTATVNIKIDINSFNPYRSSCNPTISFSLDGQITTVSNFNRQTIAEDGGHGPGTDRLTATVSFTVINNAPLKIIPPSVVTLLEYTNTSANLNNSKVISATSNNESFTLDIYLRGTTDTSGNYVSSNNYSQITTSPTITVVKES